MDMMDYLVIGAGPAGLQLGYLLAKAGRNFRILEAGSTPGTFFNKFPRHRVLISTNKVYTGTSDAELCMRMDWNSLLSDDPDLLFTKYSQRYFPQADDMVRYLNDFADKHHLPIRYDTRVSRISRLDGGTFVIASEGGAEYQARRIIVATGMSKPNIPAIPGIETAELYYDLNVDPQNFIDQRVLIIGKGNSAFETAENLIETAAVIHVAGPRSVHFAWKTHYVGHLRAVNNNFLDTYQLKLQNAILDGRIEKIARDGDGYLVTVSFVRANEVKKDLRYDRVIVCTGFRFDSSIFAEECRPNLIIDGRFPAQTSHWESPNVPDLYFAGTLMQVRDFKRSTTGFIHGFRYSVRALHHLLEKRYEGVPWPQMDLPAEPGSLMETVLARVNRSSALWQQFSFLCDLIIPGRESARYCEELPIDYVHESEFGESDCYFVITLEYGPGHDQLDPFDVYVGRIAQDEHERSNEGRYLHPVIRHYSHGRLLSAHHVTENLENDWRSEEIHRQPLQAYFARALDENRLSVSLPH